MSTSTKRHSMDNIDGISRDYHPLESLIIFMKFTYPAIEFNCLLVKENVVINIFYNFNLFLLTLSLERHETCRPLKYKNVRTLWLGTKWTKHSCALLTIARFKISSDKYHIVIKISLECMELRIYIMLY